MNPFRFIDGLARRVFLPFAGWKINTYTCKLACVSLVPPFAPFYQPLCHPSVDVACAVLYFFVRFAPCISSLCLEIFSLHPPMYFFMCVFYAFLYVYLYIYIYISFFGQPGKLPVLFFHLFLAFCSGQVATATAFDPRSVSWRHRLCLFICLLWLLLFPMLLPLFLDRCLTVFFLFLLIFLYFR